jgi:tRNA threonylcarbamoyladenosine biosynthesis protein TsaB
MTIAIDASFSPVSVALGEEGTCLWYGELPSERRPTLPLFRLLQEALAKMPSPTLILVGVGPGSFSGIRLAIAAAQGLGLAVQAPVKGIYSVWSLGWRYREEGRVGVFSDARRGELFATFFRSGYLEKGPLVLPKGDLGKWLQGLDRAISPDQAAGHLTADSPRASDLLELWFALGEDCLCPALEPVYLRKPLP